MQFTSLILTTLLTLTTAAPSAKSAGTFHIKNFGTACSDIYPGGECTTLFDVSLNSLPSANCSISSNAKSYVFCGTISPEQAYYAYIAKDENTRTLELKYEFSLPQKTTRDYGSKVLKNPSTTAFDVPAYAATTAA